jgi:hypothetical protein
MLHALRILYKQCVINLEIEKLELFTPIVAQRLQCATQISAFILEMEENCLKDVLDQISAS